MTYPELFDSIQSADMVAKALGVSRAMVYLWLNGTHPIKPGYLELLQIKHTVWKKYYPMLSFEEFVDLVNVQEFLMQ